MYLDRPLQWPQQRCVRVFISNRCHRWTLYMAFVRANARPEQSPIWSLPVVSLYLNRHVIVVCEFHMIYDGRMIGGKNAYNSYIVSWPALRPQATRSHGVITSFKRRLPLSDDYVKNQNRFVLFCNITCVFWYCFSPTVSLTYSSLSYISIFVSSIRIVLSHGSYNRNAVKTAVLYSFAFPYRLSRPPPNGNHAHANSYSYRSFVFCCFYRLLISYRCIAHSYSFSIIETYDYGPHKRCI